MNIRLIDIVHNYSGGTFLSSLPRQYKFTTHTHTHADTLTHRRLTVKKCVMRFEFDKPFMLPITDITVRNQGYTRPNLYRICLII